AGCINGTLQNVLGLGACVGDAGNLCIEDSKGIVNLVVKLVECSLKSISFLNLPTQLHVAGALVQFILRRNNLGLVADLLDLLCGTVAGALNGLLNILGLGGLLDALGGIVNCKILEVTDEITCSGVVVINLPSALNAGECLGLTLSACDGDTPVDLTVPKGIFDALTCILKNLSEADLDDTVKGLLCSVINLLKNSLGGLGDLTEPLVKLVSRLIGQRC
ncbi:unnamed protein product, partial [Ixodes pacificus]